jgi:hypothetical protein
VAPAVATFCGEHCGRAADRRAYTDQQYQPTQDAERPADEDGESQRRKQHSRDSGEAG